MKGTDTKCPECGLRDVGDRKSWTCDACGAKGFDDQRGNRMTDRSDLDKLRYAKAILVEYMAGTDVLSDVTTAADLYGRLTYMAMEPYIWHLIGDGCPTTTGGTPTEWLLPEHLPTLDEITKSMYEMLHPRPKKKDD